MTWIAFIRHGRTTWNEEGRIQGRTDTRLSDRGRSEAISWRIPIELRNATWVSSPLQRAQETARLLCFQPEIHSALIETDWGEFEGLQRDEMYRQIAERGLDPSLGIDFQPPGGESPRMVSQRLRSWLADWAADKRPLVAVTHKGVIRAALSLATGWDMRQDYPEKIRWNCAQQLFLDSRGLLTVKQLNLSLENDSLNSNVTTRG